MKWKYFYALFLVVYMMKLHFQFYFELRAAFILKAWTVLEFTDFKNSYFISENEVKYIFK